MTEQAFNKIAAGLKDAIAIADGSADPSTYRVHAGNDIDVAAIRKRLRLSQGEFASKFGLSVATVRDWEQRRRRPDRIARALLTVIDKNPEAVEAALAGG
jgi:putative transcriptional regulator